MYPHALQNDEISIYERGRFVLSTLRISPEAAISLVLSVETTIRGGYQP